MHSKDKKQAKTITPHCYVIDKWRASEKGKYLSVCVQWLNTQVVSIRRTLSSWLLVVAPGKQGRREIHEEDRASRGDQPPVVTTPVTSFTSLNYNQQHAPKVRLVSDSRLIGAADDFLDVESCIPGVLEIWTISVGVSGCVRKDTSVDPSGEMM